MVTIRLACLLIVVGMVKGQVGTTIPISNYGGISGGYSNLGGYYNGYEPVNQLGYSGDYNLGYHHQGSYFPASTNYGRIPPSFNGALPLGVGGHNGAVPLGIAGHNGALPLGIASHGGALAGYGYSGYGGVIGHNHEGVIGYNHGGYPLQHNGGVLPYSNVIGGYEQLASANGLVNPNVRVARVAPKLVQTSNEILIAHGNAGTSRQWFNRVDKN